MIITVIKGNSVPPSRLQEQAMTLAALANGREDIRTTTPLHLFTALRGTIVENDIDEKKQQVKHLDDINIMEEKMEIHIVSNEGVHLIVKVLV